MNLNIFRSDDYNEWYKVLYAIKKIDNSLI